MVLRRGHLEKRILISKVPSLGVKVYDTYLENKKHNFHRSQLKKPKLKEELTGQQKDGHKRKDVVSGSIVYTFNEVFREETCQIILSRVEGSLVKGVSLRERALWRTESIISIMFIL